MLLHIPDGTLYYLAFQYIPYRIRQTLSIHLNVPITALLLLVLTFIQACPKEPAGRNYFWAGSGRARGKVGSSSGSGYFALRVFPLDVNLPCSKKKTLLCNVHLLSITAVLGLSLLRHDRKLHREQISSIEPICMYAVFC